MHLFPKIKENLFGFIKVIQVIYKFKKSRTPLWFFVIVHFFVFGVTTKSNIPRTFTFTFSTLL